jgi:prepilin-type N-terminal cleavage/methylation domain-containing protein
MFSKNRPGERAFTLIELLVVISVIAVLTGMVLAVGGIITAKGRRARVEADRAWLIMSIEAYKKEKGVYPPDNTNNPSISGLYYELTGTFFNNSNVNSPVFVVPATQDTFTPANVATIFGRGGFVNASADKNEVQDFTRSLAKGGHTATFTTNGVNYILFGVPVPGPGERTTTEGKLISVWNYVSTNPTNNDGGFDLWLDVKYSGRVNRISNWSKDPQAQ